MWIVSACLLGLNCRYNGQAKENKTVMSFLAEKPFLALCPEALGGLPIPRPPAERQGDRVVNRLGDDVTAAFEAGAQKALAIAQQAGVTTALFKEGSPSCGVHRIYDGSFSKTKIPGVGVTTALFEKNGIDVIGEEDLK